MLPSRTFGRRRVSLSSGSVRESVFKRMYTPIMFSGHMSTCSTVRGLIKSAMSGHKLYAGVIESSSTQKQCIPDGKIMCKRPKLLSDIMIWSQAMEVEMHQ